MATPDCVVETRGGTATVCSGSDAYNHEDLFYASTPSESGKKKVQEYNLVDSIHSLVLALPFLNDFPAGA